MESQIKKFLINNPVKMPDQLESMIMQEIAVKSRRRARLHVIEFGVLNLGSIIGGIAAVLFLLKGFAQSGLSDYISLLFSDSSSMISIWKELILSVAESTPFISTAAFLTAILLFLWSLGKFTKEARTFFLTA